MEHYRKSSHTTYDIKFHLVWLRVAHFGGHFTGEEYEAEQQLVRELILSEIKNGKIHLEKYLEEWKRLEARI